MKKYNNQYKSDKEVMIYIHNPSF